MFFTVHFLVAVCKTIVEISGPSPLTMKLEGTLNLDRHTVNYAPMLAILFIWTWTHALQSWRRASSKRAHWHRLRMC